MDRELILSQLEQAYAAAEVDLKEAAAELEDKPMHGTVMPRTYVGESYGQTHCNGVRAPRTLVFSINQSRLGQELTEAEVRQSMRNIKADEDGKYLPDGFGPRSLAANLARWIVMDCGVDPKQLSPADAHGWIAYDNFVKWPFETDSSTPPGGAWQIFYPLNKRVMEILQPEIILCLGHPMYDHLWEAVKDHDGYRYEKSIPGWAYSLLAPWGRCEVGWCYHYSNPIWPNRAWRELQEEEKVASSLKSLLSADTADPATLQARMQEIDAKKPWWGTETYSGTSFTRYNPYQKFVASRVCEALAGEWKASSQ